MKKCYIGVLTTSFFMLLVLGYFAIRNPIRDSSFTSPLLLNTTNPLEWANSCAPPAVQNPEISSQVISADTIVIDLFARRNLSNKEQQSLQTWNHLKHLISHGQALSNAVEAIKEAGIAWKNLMASVEQERLNVNESSHRGGKEKQCPHFLSKMNATQRNNNGFQLGVPCGLTQGSSITIIGIPSGLLGNFRIDLTGEPLPGEPDPPIILHYNVRILGDKITEDSVIVQNSWTAAHDWGEEERCPSPAPEKNKKGRYQSRFLAS
ncbi:unnamed protein product [Ilex paraguariensis]|uniref:Galectin n=1 Tax=Ilex paraguariensis TaxID=185542 RepID=A0ABC8QUB5_9AQUA